MYSAGVSDVIRADELLCKQRWTPYDGFSVSYRLEACMLRGIWVYKDGAIHGQPAGQFISGGLAGTGAAPKRPGSASAWATSRQGSELAAEAGTGLL